MHPAFRQMATTRLVGDLRRRAGEHSLARFMEVYLDRYAKVSFSRMHLEVSGLLEDASRRRGVRLALAAPRGHAKSTLVSQAYVLWSLAYRREPYTLLISDTSDQAQATLEKVRVELETNHLLQADFPEVCQRGRGAWRKGEIVTASGAKLTALGMDSKVRGRRHREHRPTLIIVDDLENEAAVRDPKQREQLEEWFDRAVLNSGTPTTNTVVLGTILHFGSLLARLVDVNRNSGWTSRVYQAVEAFSDRQDLWDRWEAVYAGRELHEGAHGPEAAQSYLIAHQPAMLKGTRVLWPQCESYEQLMLGRLTGGRAAFDAEKQNQPVNHRDACFRANEIVYWDSQHSSEDALLAAIGPEVRLYGACDPSLGKAGDDRDDTAIITLAKDPKTKVLYVLDADIRRLRPTDIIESMIAFQRRRGWRRAAVETVQYQEFLADELVKRSREVGCPVPVYHLRPTADKMGRIQSLQPLVTSGGLRFSRRHATLIEQLLQFPHAAHDDGPDALEMAVQASHQIDWPNGRFSV